MKRHSITRRLIFTVLILETLSAIALIAAITVHERHTQLQAFDATLRGTADSLMGAVEDADDTADNVMFEMRGIAVGKNGIFRIEDEKGRVLGSAGDVTQLKDIPSTEGSQIFNDKIHGREYRFILFHGLRIVDPGEAGGGVQHRITIVYGAPVGHVWHEVFEAIRFFAIATIILLSLTAVAMVMLLKRSLSPLHELAQEAKNISSKNWRFEAPPGAKQWKELQPLARALEDALARVELSFEQQKRFTSDAAHELKTDLAIVKSSLQLLSMRKRTTEEYSQGLMLSLEDFTRLEMTVQKMLTLARLEQAPDAARQSCSLRDVLEESLHQNNPFAELKGIEVHVPEIVDGYIPIDRRDAQLLFSNVLLNALQHTPPDSTVRIETANRSGTVSITIQDEGEGIAEEDLPHLFEPFYRGDPSRSRKSGGTGLGLSISKAICERAGGSIEIANNRQGGALVTIVLPVAAVSVASC